MATYEICTVTMNQSSSDDEQNKSNSGSADGATIFADAMLEAGGFNIPCTIKTTSSTDSDLQIDLPETTKVHELRLSIAEVFIRCCY